LTTLYQRVLGDRFDALHPVLRRFHSSETPLTGRGLFRVVHHPGWLRKFLLVVLRFPAKGEAVEVLLEVTPSAAGERWVRLFAGRPLVTWQSAGGGLLMERAGPLRFGLAVEVVDGGLTFRTRRTWILGVPLPGWLAPRVEADVVPSGEGWNVAVRLTLPLVGRLLDYEGDVVPRWA
jgi:hypothetical protein